MVCFECQASFEVDCFVVPMGLLAMTRGVIANKDLGSRFGVLRSKFAQVVTLNFITLNVELF